MGRLTDYTGYADAQSHFSKRKLWELFEGGPDHFNITHECLDRHAPARVAIRVAHADGSDETLTFGMLSATASRFAHWLRSVGVARGDRVALMLDPSLAFYAALFGTMKTGAIAVPLFTLFGPDGVRLRVADCTPAILVTTAERVPQTAGLDGVRIVVADEAFLAGLQQFPPEFRAETSASDLACFQYTSGTTRELPAAVQHTHGALVVLMIAALYGTGIRPGDLFFCPSSPAWGHGLWHGTMSPLALGVQTGTMSGKFDVVRMMKALQDYRITNLSAASTHYRMMKSSGRAGEFRFACRKLSYTGEPIDSSTLEFIDETFHLPACSIYGTTEIGVILVNYPGADDFVVKPGSLGKAVPGLSVMVRRPDGTPAAVDEIGELMVERRGAWVATKDLGHVDADGYFFHGGRADDVIISAGWTMSAFEIEQVMLKHPAVREVAAIGVPDALRGQVVKAFVVTAEPPMAGGLSRELQEFTRQRLSRHEYPRLIELVDELPKTPAGKINRKALRDREAAAASSKGLATHER